MASTTTIRLADDLDSRARAHAQALGVSLNALIAFALDAYMRGSGGKPVPEPAQEQAKELPQVRQERRQEQAQPQAQALNRAQRRAQKRRK